MPEYPYRWVEAVEPRRRRLNDPFVKLIIPSGIRALPEHRLKALLARKVSRHV